MVTTENKGGCSRENRLSQNGHKTQQNYIAIKTTVLWHTFEKAEIAARLTHNQQAVLKLNTRPRRKGLS